MLRSPTGASDGDVPSVVAWYVDAANEPGHGRVRDVDHVKAAEIVAGKIAVGAGDGDVPHFAPRGDAPDHV
jgi:hypothetical protein